MHFCRSDFANPVDFFYCKFRDEIVDVVRQDSKLSVGFVPIASDFGKKLIRRYAGRNGYAYDLAHLVSYCLSNSCRAASKLIAVADIQKGFV